MLHDLPLSPAVREQVDRGAVVSRPVPTLEPVLEQGGPVLESEESEEAEPDEPVLEAEEWDPGAHTVDEVRARLATATPEERARIIAAETAGRHRTTLVGS